MSEETGGAPGAGHDGDRGYLFRRSLDARLMFAVVWTVIASAIYFSLGVVAGYALGLTPVVFLAGGLMFALALMTYVEGGSLHQDRAGSTVFARYAFNELWSFIAGWAMLLDYIILLAVCVFTATNYLDPFWSELSEGHRRAPRLLRPPDLRRGPQHPRVLDVALAPRLAAGGRRHRRPGWRSSCSAWRCCSTPR